MNEQEKSDFRQDARLANARNAVARRNELERKASDLEEAKRQVGPWGLVQPVDDWPLSPKVISKYEEAKGGFAKAVNEWKQEPAGVLSLLWASTGFALLSDPYRI